jgi:hypothetical protein
MIRQAMSYDRVRFMSANPLSVKEREAVDEIWQRTLVRILSSYGRLVYLSGLRDPDTGRYEYFGAGADSSNTNSSRTLMRLHEGVFQQWVDMSLEQKMADIQLYISGLDQVDRGELIDAWQRLTPYKNLVPATIVGPERRRHFSDIEALLGLLKNVYGVASPDPYV